MSDRARCLAILVLVGLAYFVAYPEDAQAVTMPFATFLNLTTLVSPWLYGVVAVAILSGAIVKTWGRRGDVGNDASR